MIRLDLRLAPISVSSVKSVSSVEGIAKGSIDFRCHAPRRQCCFILTLNTLNTLLTLLTLFTLLTLNTPPTIKERDGSDDSQKP